MTTTEDLTDRALELAAAARQAPSFEQVRQMLNEVGITRARLALAEAPDLVANAHLALDEAREVEAQAKAAYDQVVSAAEYLLQSCFETRGAKTWLTIEPDGTLIAEEDQRPFLADEKKAWIADKAAREPDVRTVQVAYSGATRRRKQAADELAVAELRFDAAKHGLDAAAAELTFLGLSLRSIPTNQES